jgi:predicted protein tyrosine phosphatase
MNEDETEPLNVLFVCSRNPWRSPTAETVFRHHDGLRVRSGGTSPNARHRVSVRDVAWADVIFVMEPKHKSRLVAAFRDTIAHRTIHVLDIPDVYGYMDDELVEHLRTSVGAILEL